jgi:hypothetical protein
MGLRFGLRLGVEALAGVDLGWEVGLGWGQPYVSSLCHGLYPDVHSVAPGTATGADST